MYISPISKNAIRNKFFPHKEIEKEKEKEDNDKKSLSKILYNQKKYVKMLPTKKLVSRNIDYFKRNPNKIMMRNKSNIEQSIKFASNDNSIFKNEDNFMNRTKNLISYNSEIYTPKHNKNQSSTSIFKKTKYENNNNYNQKQQNKNMTNSRKNNYLIKNFLNNDLAKEKKDPQNKNKIFSFPASPKNNKNNTKIFSNINNDMNNNKIIKSFMLSQKPDISFHNFSSNSSMNIFKSKNHDTNNDIKINSYYNNSSRRKNEMNINLVSQSKKTNKTKVDYDFININNKNIGAYLKKVYFNNGKYNKDIKEKNNRNNNYILINHLLLNDINITGNNSGNIVNENMGNSKYKPKTSRNVDASKNISSKEKMYPPKNDNNNNINNDIIQSDNYLNLSETNINSENLDIKKKIDFYKTKANFNNSPEENHFDTVKFLQRMKLSNNIIK